MHPGRVGDIAVVQMQVLPGEVFVVMKMIDTRPVEGARAPDESVDLITLFEELLSHIRAVLARHTGNESTFGLHNIDLPGVQRPRPYPERALASAMAPTPDKAVIQECRKEAAPYLLHSSIA